KTGEGIPDIYSAILYKNEQPFIDLLKDPNFKIEHIKVNDYKTQVKGSYQTPVDFGDGEYKVTVKAKSEVGMSEGSWTYWIDTKPPNITFTMKQVRKK
ncbi:hypothetical protein ACFL52_03685, partial [Candidatus Margulisiibacteriota bacterium]